ncbi:MAG: hypothetical protein OXN85_11695, partial [Gemmatimonadetes bacterium]|nr:hypothetical protein [Candidatus Palauibacter australiensis]
VGQGLGVAAAVSPRWACLLLWLKHRLRRVALERIPGFHRLDSGYDYMEMLDISNVGDFEQSYSLPTTLHDEASRPW